MRAAGRPVSTTRRAAARLVDAVLVLVWGYGLTQVAKLSGPINTPTELPLWATVLMEAASGGIIVWLVYETVSVARWGATVGKLAFGLRVSVGQHADAGQQPHWIDRYRRLMKRRLAERVRQLEAAAAQPEPPRTAAARLQVAEARMEQLELPRSGPGVLHAAARTVALVGCLVVPLVVVSAARAGLPDAVAYHDATWIAAVAVAAVVSLAACGLWSSRGLHDRISATGLAAAPTTAGT